MNFNERIRKARAEKGPEAVREWEYTRLAAETLKREGDDVDEIREITEQINGFYNGGSTGR